MIDQDTKDAIEMGRAMMCNGYVIEAQTDVYGRVSGSGVYVFDQAGNSPDGLHLDEKTDLFEPVSLDKAIEWCQAH